MFPYILTLRKRSSIWSNLPQYVAHGKNMICKLKKAIYGLKQNPRAWFDKFSRIIFAVEFQECYSDHSVFIRKTPSSTMILIVYVDILLTESDIDGTKKTKRYFKIQFARKDEGRPRYFLRIEIAPNKHGVVLSQTKYALDLLQKNELLGCKLVQ